MPARGQRAGGGEGRERGNEPGRHEEEARRQGGNRGGPSMALVMAATPANFRSISGLWVLRIPSSPMNIILYTHSSPSAPSLFIPSSPTLVGGGSL
eukprot:768554-Hanusia_phi.AAC.8